MGEIKYIEYIDKTAILYELLENYAESIRLIEPESKKLSILPKIQESKRKIDEIVEVYNEIKNVDPSVFVEFLLLKDKPTQKYFFDRIDSLSKKRKKHLSKIFQMRDQGMFYDNCITQKLNKEPMMREVFYFVFNKDMTFTKDYILSAYKGEINTDWYKILKESDPDEIVEAQVYERNIIKPNVVIKDKIEEYFSFLRETDPRKKKVILLDDDFEKFIHWITYYFYNDFKVPVIDTPISSINTAKGNVIYALKSFFREEYPNHVYPDTLFELYRNSFYSFREDKLDNFKKQREPQYFKYLIKKHKKAQ